MNHRTKFPSGSPRDILIRLRRIEHQIKQQLADIQAVNDNNRNFADKPMDVGRYLVQLKKMREVIGQVRTLIADGAQKLPDGILDPINEPW